MIRAGDESLPNRRFDGVLIKLLLLVLLWVMLPFAVAEVGVRLWRPGFPGYRLPQVEHRPAVPYGFELTPGQLAFNLAQPVTVNDAGYRGPRLRERGTQLRVVCIGDSFTFGYGVADGDTYPRQLERLLRERWPERDPEVINAGVQGYATYHEIDFLRHRGLSLRPDVVVLAIYHNDLEVRPEGEYASQYREALTSARKSFRHQFPRLNAALQNSAVITLAKKIYQARRQSADEATRVAAEGVEADAVWRSMQRELAMFKQLADGHDFLPVVMVIPGRAHLVGAASESRYPGQVLTLAQEIGLEAIDLRPRLAASLKAGVDVYLAWDHHHSPAGNLVLGRAVRDRLSSIIVPLHARPTEL